MKNPCQYCWAKPSQKESANVALVIAVIIASFMLVGYMEASL